jgi:signal transduction histidine kinase
MRGRLLPLAARPHVPRRTVRLRLTLLYGGLFLASGAALLAITYVLVVHNTRGFIFETRDGARSTVLESPDDTADRPPGAQGFEARSGGPGGARRLSPEQLREEERRVAEQEARAREQRANVLDQLLVQSGIALGAMGLASIALGWIVAGRVLAPLRTITAGARNVSATNLHDRLALDGPDDELKELGDTFDALLERLEAAFQSQRRFVANASHELRSPLARQRTVAQVALADPDATAESLRAAHERVLASGAQQERLIEALLTLTRGQAGLDKRESFDLATVTDQVVLARQPEAERLGVGLHATLAHAPADGAPRLVERLVANLVDNALLHNTRDGRVEITSQTRAGHAVLAVVNTGPVVPVTAIDQILQPFQRLGADRTGHRDGLGLGLSIVKAIADAHGAILAVHPQASGGLRIEVSFPTARGNIQGASDHEPSSTPDRQAASQTRAQTKAPPGRP